MQDFEQALLEADGWNWHNNVRKGYLKAAINWSLKERLVAVPEPPLYTNYVALLRLTSDNLDELEASKQR